jgi:hypothetical protein
MPPRCAFGHRLFTARILGPGTGNSPCAARRVLARPVTGEMPRTAGAVSPARSSCGPCAACRVRPSAFSALGRLVTLERRVCLNIRFSRRTGLFQCVSSKEFFRISPRDGSPCAELWAEWSGGMLRRARRDGMDRARGSLARRPWGGQECLGRHGRQRVGLGRAAWAGRPVVTANGIVITTNFFNYEIAV